VLEVYFFLVLSSAEQAEKSTTKSIAQGQRVVYITYQLCLFTDRASNS
jgi:hypothetical protein